MSTVTWIHGPQGCGKSQRAELIRASLIGHVEVFEEYTRRDVPASQADHIIVVAQHPPLRKRLATIDRVLPLSGSAVTLPYRYIVVRHSGRRTDASRTVCMAAYEARAWTLYHHHAESLRQGCVAIVDTLACVVLAITTAGNNRTRW